MTDDPMRAQTREPIHDLLARRRSPHAFAADPLGDAELVALLEAARWSASCFNEQPWRFVVARRGRGDDHARLAACLVEANRAWAERAPVLLLAVACESFTRNGKPNRHAGYDTGQAMQNLVVQATSLGLIVHQMGGFDPDMARRELGIPEGFTPMAVAAVGRPGRPDDLPAALAARDGAARARRPLEEIAFSGRWGEALDA